MIDLHAHSTASDGTLTPSQLVRRGEAIGLTALALTDHDTTDGLQEFLSAAENVRMEPVPGVEIACSLSTDSVHIVGLFVKPGGRLLEKLLKKIRSSRNDRNRKIVGKLRRRGIGITFDQVRNAAGGDVIGRPHIARVLVDDGWCASPKAAFEEFLASGRRAYVPRFRPEAVDGIRAIHDAGGVAIWAHPVGYRTISEPGVWMRAAAMRKWGLDGIEYYYSEYSAENERTVRNVGTELGLLASGGSDFHGDTVPGTDLGVGKGNLCVPDDLVEPLRERADGYRRAGG